MNLNQFYCFLIGVLVFFGDGCLLSHAALTEFSEARGRVKSHSTEGDNPSVLSASVKAQQSDPWELSLPLVEMGEIKEGDQINRCAQLVFQLQESYEDEAIRGWVALGSQYAGKVRKNLSACDDILRLVSTLAAIDEVYPRTGLLTSSVVYEALMTHYAAGLLPTWSQQEHYVWSAASALQGTNDAEQTHEIMRRSFFWIMPSHTPEEKNKIIELVAQIIINKPYVYKPTFDRVQERFGPSFFAASQVIPFLQGLHAGTWSDVEVSGSSSSAASSSAASDAESKNEDDFALARQRGAKSKFSKRKRK